MSTSGISSSMFSQLQQFQQEFQQLGTDLSSGNLSAAQSDFVTLQSDLQQTSSTSTSASTSQNTNPIAQAFSQLSQDLQAGNLTAAQQDYSTIQQAFQSQASQTRHHHHRHGSGGGEDNQVSQLFAQVGQDLQSGNLSSAQSDFSALQQLLQESTGSSTTGGSTYSGVSVTA